MLTQYISIDTDLDGLDAWERAIKTFITVEGGEPDMIYMLHGTDLAGAKLDMLKADDEKEAHLQVLRAKDSGETIALFWIDNAGAQKFYPEAPPAEPPEEAPAEAGEGVAA